MELFETKSILVLHHLCTHVSNENVKFDETLEILIFRSSFLKGLKWPNADQDTLYRAKYFDCFDLLYLQDNSQNAPLVGSTLETLLRFLNWIPLGYIFETKLITTLIYKVILYTYELVMRAIASFWFPET